MASLRLEGIEKRWPNGRTALRGIDLEVGDGEFLVLVGPSGCGKSTLLRIVAGLTPPSAGRVVIGDRDVTDLRAPGADERVSREGLGTSWLLVGPLPAGTYRAEAVAEDGRRGEGRIRLAGEYEEVLEVEL